jgi:hypothetical protein
MAQKFNGLHSLFVQRISLLRMDSACPGQGPSFAPGILER